MRDGGCGMLISEQLTVGSVQKVSVSNRDETGRWPQGAGLCIVTSHKCDRPLAAGLGPTYRYAPELRHVGRQARAQSPAAWDC